MDVLCFSSIDFKHVTISKHCRALSLSTFLAFPARNEINLIYRQNKSFTSNIYVYIQYV